MTNFELNIIMARQGGKIALPRDKKLNQFFFLHTIDMFPLSKTFKVISNNSLSPRKSKENPNSIQIQKYL